jgi:cell division protein FtsN
MKKFFLLGMGLCVALAFSSCKSSKESAYKKAYEKAKQQELAETPAPTTAESTTTVTTPAPAPKVVENVSVANTAGVRQEKLQVVSGNDTLQDYSVVCGSFGVKANAESLKDYLVGQGYPAMVAFAPETKDGPMYRVIVSSYADRASAAEARNAFKNKYSNRKDFQGAWLLYRIK